MTMPGERQDVLKRLLRWYLLPYAILAAGIILLAAVLYLNVTGLERDTRRIQAAYRDNLPWYASQFGRELSAFIAALDAYHHLDGPLVTKGDLVGRFGAFRRRIDGADQGAAGATYMSFADVRPLIENARRVMRDIEPMVMSLQPADSVAHRSIKEKLQGLPAAFHRASLLALRQPSREMSGVHRRLEKAHAKLLVIFAGVLAGGAVLIGLILLEMRQINAWRTFLKRQIEERTRDLWQETAERQKTAEILRDSEQRFRDFAEFASDWFWELGPSLRFSYLSERFEPATGISPDHILGKSYVEFGKPDKPDEVWVGHLEDVDARRPFRDFRLELFRRDGEAVYVSLNGTPRCNEAGTFLGYRGTGTNITERVESEKAFSHSEERYRRLVDLSPDGILIHVQDKIAFANPAALRLLGAENTDDLFGRSLLDFVDPQYHKIAKLRIEEVLDKGREQPQSEQVFVGIDGRAFPVLCSATSLPHDEGRAVLTLFRDISRVKKTAVRSRRSP